MKPYALLPIIFLLVGPFSAEAHDTKTTKDTVFQVSTLHSLLAGDYDGRATFRLVERQGDFGLGTFDALDGEMIALDGKYFQIAVDGKPRRVHPRTSTPFAVVTFFQPDDSFLLETPGTCKDLREVIFDHLPSEDLLYGIKISGTFSELQTRSVPAQEQPYVPLEEALKGQVVFNFQYVDATLVGFWLPEALGDVNATEFHFHALTADEQGGGHVLDCEVLNARVEIDYTNTLEVMFGSMKRTFGQKEKRTQKHRSQRHSLGMVPW